jgi:hypothetical protein
MLQGLLIHPRPVSLTESKHIPARRNLHMMGGVGLVQVDIAHLNGQEPPSGMAPGH